MKKGYTLVELLGVMIILGLILLVSFPIIINQIKKSNEAISESTKLLIYNSADLYINDRADEYLNKPGKIYNISINDLINEGLLSGNLKDLDKDYCVIIEVTDNNGNYEKTITDDCTIDVNITSIDGNPTSWTNRDVTLIVETNSRVAEYCFNDVCQESNQMSFSSNQTVNVQIKDDMGNVLDSAEVIIDKIDKVKPTIVASVASIEWTEASVAITSTSDDGGSGLESTSIYSYYIKSSSDSDSAYELKYQGTDTSYTFVDLDELHSYDIKITVSDKALNVGEIILTAGTSCFVAGTKVLTVDGLKNIEDIKVGDYVYTLNVDNNMRELKQVLDTFEGLTDELYDIKIGDQLTSATPKHQFYVVDKGWIRAHDLEIGDVLVAKDNSTMVIEEINHRNLTTPETIYNLTVDTHHNYLITEYEILVHNAPSFRE